MLLKSIRLFRHCASNSAFLQNRKRKILGGSSFRRFLCSTRALDQYLVCCTRQRRSDITARTRLPEKVMDVHSSNDPLCTRRYLKRLAGSSAVTSLAHGSIVVAIR
jgi:hypothetical protein